MNSLSLNEYQRYYNSRKEIEDVRKNGWHGTGFPPSEHTLHGIERQLFARIFDLEGGDVPDNLVMIPDDAFAVHPVKKALDSLQINGNPMFEGETTRLNYWERVTQAMDQIIPAMVQPDSVSVPYVRHPDGNCEAIKPYIPAARPVIPEKPAWYKRAFKGIVSSWNKECETYRKAEKDASDWEKMSAYVHRLDNLAEQPHTRIRTDASQMESEEPEEMQHLHHVQEHVPVRMQQASETDSRRQQRQR